MGQLSPKETEAAAANANHPAHEAVKLARHLGNLTILQKGKVDIITNGKEVVACGAAGALSNNC